VSTQSHQNHTTSAYDSSQPKNVQLPVQFHKAKVVKKSEIKNQPLPTEANLQTEEGPLNYNFNLYGT
jgi:hypothetical protein